MAADDVIELRGLRVTGVVGVLPHEQAGPQPLEVDLDIVADLQAAGDTDDLADTVDYGAVCATVEEVVQSSSPALLEALAAMLADAVLAQDQKVTSVVVSIRKLRPPVPQQLATSGVRITRRRT